MTGLVPFGKYKLNSKSDSFGDFFGMLDDFFTDSWYPSRSFINDNFAIDVNETDKEYQVEAELPGIKKEEIKVEMDKGRLIVIVERDENINHEKKNYVYKERKYSSMQRFVYLADAKDDKIKAKLKDGVLYIIVPKQEKLDTVKKIEIE